MGPQCKGERFVEEENNPHFKGVVQSDGRFLTFLSFFFLKKLVSKAPSGGSQSIGGLIKTSKIL